MKFNLFLFFLLFSIGCASNPPTKRNAELVVTYNDKVVHRASPIYSNLQEFERAVAKKEMKYIIFGAAWCPPCKNLYKAIEQGGWKDKVVILNLDVDWVADLYQVSRMRIVPAMIVLDSENQFVTAKQGSSNIIMHLVINVP